MLGELPGHSRYDLQKYVLVPVQEFVKGVRSSICYGVTRFVGECKRRAYDQISKETFQIARALFSFMDDICRYVYPIAIYDNLI